jgi:hypothetical protein
MLVFDRIEARWTGAGDFQILTGRAKIPGGWLVGNGQTVLCFVPDPEHRWDGSSIPAAKVGKDAKGTK